MERVLHNYFRSSASYRVRIALNLKQLPFSYRPVHLSRGGGEQFLAGFQHLNPQHLIPVLEDGGLLSQSVAILEYLEEKYPQPPLLPDDPFDRAYVRGLALYCACDVHPLTNLRVLTHLTGEMALSAENKSDWIAHWIGLGLKGLEATISQSRRAGRFCFGDHPTMADCSVVPLVFSARRFQVDMRPFARLNAIDHACNELDAFRSAHPGRQPDTE